MQYRWKWLKMKQSMQEYYNMRIVLGLEII